MISLAMVMNSSSSIPAILVNSNLGADLQTSADLNSVSVMIIVYGKITPVLTWNILADTFQGDVNNTIVIGSHLDSVYEGPGINDNGSGTSINLALALQMARKGLNLKNRIRFAWWAAEEEGLLGSLYYGASLNPEEVAQIVANVDLDMIASPNFERGIYNGSAAEDPKILNGSIYIQNLFTDAFTALGVNYTFVEFDGRSDYAFFIANGIPAGGIFAGAEEIKTMEGRFSYGGFANSAYDPCYHAACDTYQNVNQQVLQEMANVTATISYTLGQLSSIRNTLGLGPIAPTKTKRNAFPIRKITDSKAYQHRFNLI